MIRRSVPLMRCLGEADSGRSGISGESRGSLGAAWGGRCSRPVVRYVAPVIGGSLAGFACQFLCAIGSLAALRDGVSVRAGESGRRLPSVSRQTNRCR